MTLEDALQKKNAARYKAQNDAASRLYEIIKTVPEFAATEQAVRSFPSRMLAIYKDKSTAEQNMALLRAEIDDINRKRRIILKENGYPEDYCDPKYECSECGDNGYKDGKICSCVKRMMSEVNYAESGIGKALLDKTFDNFSLSFYSRTSSKSGEKSDFDRMSRIVAKCQAFAESFPDCGNLLMMGGTGLGKTHLSAAIAKQVISRGFSVHYDTAPAVFACFDAVRFGRKEPTSKDIYFDCDLLVLDDLGAENQSAQNVSVLFELINSRMLGGRSTIISTNMTYGEIKKAYNDRIASRLMGEYALLQFVGKDVRGQKIGL